VNVVANALYYNPALALQQLQAQGRTQAFFATWFQVRRNPLSLNLQQSQMQYLRALQSSLLFCHTVAIFFATVVFPHLEWIGEDDHLHSASFAALAAGFHR